MLRGKMAELVAHELERPDTEAYFTVGLFSVIDAFMNMRMEDVLAELPLGPDVSAALLRRAGPMGEVLEWVTAYERGEFEALGRAGRRRRPDPPRRLRPRPALRRRGLRQRHARLNADGAPERAAPGPRR